ncbi:hypothetical protein ACC692_36945, partial [Rhizobium ruizarguesonis]
LAALPLLYVFGFTQTYVWLPTDSFFGLLPSHCAILRTEIHMKGVFGRYACCDSEHPMLDGPRISEEAIGFSCDFWGKSKRIQDHMFGARREPDFG